MCRKKSISVVSSERSEWEFGAEGVASMDQSQRVENVTQI